MLLLIDTNVLLRWARAADREHLVCRAAIEAAKRRGIPLLVTAQNLIEFWNVATRPADRNGFSLTPSKADAELALLERAFTIAPDTSAIYSQWRRLVVSVGVSGVQVHDARLAAAMIVHGVTHILTLNPRDFSRYPGIVPVHPSDIDRHFPA